ARKRGYRVPEHALAGTTAWLLKPREWGAARSSEGSSDKKLARIQFAAALADVAGGGAAIEVAAAELAPLQEVDGSWHVDGDTSIGSPVTYGACLATYMARRTLEHADASKYAGRIARADAW